MKKKDIKGVEKNDRIQLLNVEEKIVQTLILLLEKQQQKQKIIKNKLNPKRKTIIHQMKNLLLEFLPQVHPQIHLQVLLFKPKRKVLLRKQRVYLPIYQTVQVPLHRNKSTKKVKSKEFALRVVLDNVQVEL